MKLDLKAIKCYYLKKLSACFPIRQILSLPLTFSGPEPLHVNADHGPKQIQTRNQANQRSMVQSWVCALFQCLLLEGMQLECSVSSWDTGTLQLGTTGYIAHCWLPCQCSSTCGKEQYLLRLLLIRIINFKPSNCSLSVQL